MKVGECMMRRYLLRRSFHSIPTFQPPKEIDRRCSASIIAEVRHRWEGRKELWSGVMEGAPESGGIPKFFQRGAAAE